MVAKQGTKRRNDTIQTRGSGKRYRTAQRYLASDGKGWRGISIVLWHTESEDELNSRYEDEVSLMGQLLERADLVALMSPSVLYRGRCLVLLKFVQPRSCGKKCV